MSKKFGKKTKEMMPHIKILQRRYKTQRSIPIHDAELIFDIRTSLPSMREKQAIKPQIEWLDAVFNIMRNKKSNIQFQIGVKFPYSKDGETTKKEADQLIVDSWISCKPFIDAVAR